MQQEFERRKMLMKQGKGIVSGTGVKAVPKENNKALMAIGNIQDFGKE